MTIRLSAHNSVILPWAEPAADSRRLLIANLITFSLLLGLFLFASVIELPEPEREELEKVPPRLARVVLEKRAEVQKPVAPELKAPPPKPQEPKPISRLDPTPVKPVAVAPKPAAKPAPEAKSQPREKPKPSAEQIQKARERASKTGVLALKSTLSSMQELADIDRIKTQSLASAKGKQSTRAEKDMIATRADEGSGGIEVTQVAKPARQQLAGRATTEVQAPAELAALSGPEGNAKIRQRTNEEIGLVFDKNKAAFYALYRRALRTQLGLAGDVVFELTIEPSGEVSACRIRSSELNHTELERKLVARVRLFDFGARDVEPYTGPYTVTFSPNG